MEGRKDKKGVSNICDQELMEVIWKKKNKERKKEKQDRNKENNL